MTARRLLELALRTAAFALLAWALWLAFFPERTTLRASGRMSHVRRALPEWTRAGSALHLRLTVDEPGSAADRAWLGALSRAGGSLRWAPDEDFHPAALALEPLADPSGRVSLAIHPGSDDDDRRWLPVREGDAVVDSIARPRGDSAAHGLVLPPPRQPLAAGGATASLRDSLVLKPVLVVGAAGWEARFTAAALEEAGWRVERRFTVAPGLAAASPALLPPDTARHAAVVLLDSAAAPLAAAVARFAGQGGGVVVAGTAARIPALASLLPARLAPRVRPSIFAPARGGATVGSAGFWPLVPGPGATVLQREGDAVTVAARVLPRRGAAFPGRVVQVGYDESWRWRMEGDEAAPLAHRDWWSRVVAGVAFAPMVALPDAAPGAAAPAPLASLHEALGAPSPGALDERTLLGRTRPDPRVLLGAIFLLLLAEWGSRRLRGER